MANRLAYPLLLLLLLSSCARSPDGRPDRNAPESMADNSRNAVDWPGSYYGELNDAEGRALPAALSLEREGRYTLRIQASEGAGQAITYRGDFEWMDDGGSIRLRGVDSLQYPIYYRVGERSLRQTDLVTYSIEGRPTQQSPLTQDVAALGDTTWVLAEIDQTSVADTKGAPTLSFDLLAKRVSGTGGCNRYSASIMIDLPAQKLQIAAPLSTKMACPQLKLEQQFFGALTRADSFARQGRKLVLLDINGSEVASFLPGQEKENGTPKN